MKKILKITSILTLIISAFYACSSSSDNSEEVNSIIITGSNYNLMSQNNICTLNFSIDTSSDLSKVKYFLYKFQASKTGEIEYKTATINQKAVSFTPSIPICNLQQSVIITVYTISTAESSITTMPETKNMTQVYQTIK